MALVHLRHCTDTERPQRLPFTGFPISGGTRLSSFEIHRMLWLLRNPRLPTYYTLLFDYIFMRNKRIKSSCIDSIITDGTDVNFRATPSYLRHAMSLKLEPVRSLFPDKDIQPDTSTSPTHNLSDWIREIFYINSHITISSYNTLIQ